VEQPVADALRHRSRRTSRTTTRPSAGGTPTSPPPAAARRSAAATTTGSCSTASPGVGQPTTWVYAADRSPPGSSRACRPAGTTVSWQPPALGGPRLVLDVVEEWSGRAAMLGGTVPRRRPAAGRGDG
jgi:hypothetical protein